MIPLRYLNVWMRCIFDWIGLILIIRKLNLLSFLNNFKWFISKFINRKVFSHNFSSLVLKFYLLINFLLYNLIINNSFDSRVIRSGSKYINFGFDLSIGLILKDMLLLNLVIILGRFNLFKFLFENMLLLFLKLFNFFVFLIYLCDWCKVFIYVFILYFALC